MTQKDIPVDPRERMKWIIVEMGSNEFTCDKFCELRTKLICAEESNFPDNPKLRAQTCVSMATSGAAVSPDGISL
jgi:hypothetical protein